MFSTCSLLILNPGFLSASYVYGIWSYGNSYVQVVEILLMKGSSLCSTKSSACKSQKPNKQWDWRIYWCYWNQEPYFPWWKSLGSGWWLEASYSTTTELPSSKSILQWMEVCNICEQCLCLCTRWCHQDVHTQLSWELAQQPDCRV